MTSNKKSWLVWCVPSHSYLKTSWWRCIPIKTTSQLSYNVNLKPSQISLQPPIVSPVKLFAHYNMQVDTVRFRSANGSGWSTIPLAVSRIGCLAGWLPGCLAGWLVGWLSVWCSCFVFDSWIMIAGSYTLHKPYLMSGSAIPYSWI